MINSFSFYEPCRFFKTESGKQQLFVEEKKQHNSYKLLFTANLNSNEVEKKTLSELLAGKQIKEVGNFYSYEAKNLNKLFKFIFFAKETHLISDGETLQLQNFIKSATSLPKHIEIEDDLLLNIEKFSDEWLCEMPVDSFFSDTDLAIFKDSFTGNLPINGIKESEFKQTSKLYGRICRGDSHIKVQFVPGNPAIEVAIKMLLTRDIGRRLIDKCASHKKLEVQIRPGQRSQYDRGKKLIKLNLYSDLQPVVISPDGLRKLSKPNPLHISLAHELVHHLHYIDKLLMSHRDLPTLEKEYDDLEEQATITGFYKEPELSDFISVEMLAKIYAHFEMEVEGKQPLELEEEKFKLIYDEFNERVIHAAFTNSKHVSYPRFGHHAFHIGNTFEPMHRLHACLAELAKEDLVFDLLKLLVKARARIDLNPWKAWKTVMPFLDKLALASKNPEHPWYEALQNSQCKAHFLTLESLTSERLAFFSIKENVLADLKDGMHVENISGAWLEDEDVLVAAIEQGLTVSSLSAAQLSKKKVLIAAIEHGLPVSSISEALLSEKEVLVAAIQHGLPVANIDDTWLEDEDVLIAALKQGLSLEIIQATWLKDLDVVLAAIERGMPLASVPEPFRKKRIVVLAAAERDGSAFKDASKMLQKDKLFCSIILLRAPTAFRYFSREVKENRDFTKNILRNRALDKPFLKDGIFVLEHVGSTLQNDKEIVLAAVAINGRMLQYASEALQGDREVVLVAITQDPASLMYASSQLQQDLELRAIANKKESVL